MLCPKSQSKIIYSCRPTPTTSQSPQQFHSHHCQASGTGHSGGKEVPHPTTHLILIMQDVQNVQYREYCFSSGYCLLCTLHYKAAISISFVE